MATLDVVSFVAVFILVVNQVASLWWSGFPLDNTSATHPLIVFFRVVCYHRCDLPCEPCEHQDTVWLYTWVGSSTVYFALCTVHCVYCVGSSTAVQRNPGNYQQRVEGGGKPAIQLQDIGDAGHTSSISAIGATWHCQLWDRDLVSCEYIETPIWARWGYARVLQWLWPQNRRMVTATAKLGTDSICNLWHPHIIYTWFRGAFKSNFWKKLGFCPNWGGGGLPILNFDPIFPRVFLLQYGGVPQSQPTKSPKVT